MGGIGGIERVRGGTGDGGGDGRRQGGGGAAVQPAVVAGTLGYVVGTPLGCAAGTALRGISGGGF